MASRSRPILRRATSGGTTSPTKPIGPTVAMAAPQNSEMEASASNRVARTDTPRAAAALSPSVRRSSRGATAMARISAMPAAGRAAATIVIETPAVSPTSQKRICCNVSSLSMRMAEVSVPASVESAMPQKMSFAGVNPCRPDEARRRTREKLTPAPVAASNGRRAGVAISPSGVTVAATTARLAPAFRPRICGSPSGFRSSVCSRSPATPRQAPACSAASRRGRRSRSKTCWSKLRAS
ncbi:hypothetical protein D3C80_515940 [compost metagenome]